MAAPKRRATASGRVYEVDGVAYPSVTTILGVIGKPALIKWAENTTKAAVMGAAADLYVDLTKIGPLTRAGFVTSLESRLGKQRQTEREMQKAAEIGSQAHALIEWTLRRQLGQAVGPRPATTGPAEWAFMACEDWMKAVNLEPVHIEQTVWSETYGYAGTLDLVCRIDTPDGRRTVLLDWKTGKSVYHEAFLQNAAYQYAMEEMGHGLPDGGGLIVRLPKHDSDPEFEVVPVPPAAPLFETFKAAIALWRWWAAAEAESRAAWMRKRQAEEAVA